MRLRWLEGRKQQGYVTWGLPWRKGEVRAGEAFYLRGDDGAEYPVQTRPRAYWPDGSVKWTLHTACPSGGSWSLERGSRPYSAQLHQEEQKICAERLTVDFSEGKAVPRVEYDGAVRCVGGELLAKVKGTEYYGTADTIRFEENGPLRAVIRVQGSHQNAAGERLLPFTLRYYIHAGDPEIRIVHTFVHDADPFTQKIEALGICFDADLKEPIYNRHVRVGGECGYLKESCVLLNSWRPKLPAQWYHTQIAGGRLSLNREEHPEAYQAMEDMTWWDRWKLVQDSSEHYKISKHTGEEDCSWVDGPEGHRARGILSAAGLTVTLRDFWQKHPSALEVSGMLGEQARLSAWIWCEDVPPMDLRPYTKRPCSQSYYGQGTPSRSIPSGIAVTNEIHLTVTDPLAEKDEILDELWNGTQKGAFLAANPEYYHQVRAFGVWSLPRYDTPVERALEKELDTRIAFYQREQEQRKWYGLWNYGDWMHTYDPERHSWRYDMGGWAWQNTELVPTLWLWYMFLRSGREDVFSMAEDMCRHTSEVDIHHSGPFAGLGSRHNVKHWGGSAKEARISMAQHHRFYYYLTGDERVGDIMDEVKDADLTTKDADPLYNYYTMTGQEPYCTHARTGPDWSSYCGNWMTRWERFQDTAYRDKMTRGIAGIAAAPYRFLSGTDFGYDPDTGTMYYIGERGTGGVHLALCMGEPQLYLELMDILEDPAWDDMMVQYGWYYFLSPEEKLAYSNPEMAQKGWGMPMSASPLAAYAARASMDEKLGREVWDCLFAELLKRSTAEYEAEYVTGRIREVPTLSTNTNAQWCLNVITCLDLVRERLPEEVPTQAAEKFRNWKG